MGDIPGSREPSRSVSALSGFDPDRLCAAIALAAETHKGQRDKGGHPYILHPLRVMERCQTEDTRIAAALHDTVEDCGLELGLIKQRFGPTIACAVDALSRREGESYGDFIGRCSADPIARIVKIADLQDNMNMERLGREPTIDDTRRFMKYSDALNALLWAGHRDSDTRPKDGDAKLGSTRE